MLRKRRKTFLVNDSTISSALKPYLGMIGITSTTDKKQLEHYNAVKTDLMQTLLEAEAKNGGHLNWDQVNRVVLKTLIVKFKLPHQDLSLMIRWN